MKRFFHKRLLSRVEALESMMIKLIAAKDKFEYGCRACQHNKSIEMLDGRKITYCELYVSGYCHDFKALESDLKSSE